MPLIVLAFLWMASMATLWCWPIPDTDNFQTRVRHGNQEFNALDWTAYRRASSRYTLVIVTFALVNMATVFVAVNWFEQDLRNVYSWMVSNDVDWRMR